MGCTEDSTHGQRACCRSDVGRRHFARRHPAIYPHWPPRMSVLQRSTMAPRRRPLTAAKAARTAVPAWPPSPWFRLCMKCTDASTWPLLCSSIGLLIWLQALAQPRERDARSFHNHVPCSRSPGPRCGSVNGTSRGQGSLERLAVLSDDPSPLTGCPARAAGGPLQSAPAQCSRALACALGRTCSNQDTG